MNLHTRLLRAVAGLTIALAAVGGTLAAGLTPAGASTGFGWLRLAHLSPNTPAVDVYLYSVGKPSALVVLKHVAYGDESPYERVAAGDYTVAMRAAGSTASSKPVLSTTVDVLAGRAYTVAGMGPLGALRLQVLQDDLSTPPGEALVRIIQASLQDKRVTVTLGTHAVAKELEFGAVTAYETVMPGTMTAHVSGGADTASSQVTFPAGSIHTLVVLDDPGHLAIQVLADAAGSSAVPSGAAGTGYGGTAGEPGPGLVLWFGSAFLGLMLACAGALRMRSRRAGMHARA